jgi:hypothetical protein
MKPIAFAVLLFAFSSAVRADEYDEIVNNCNFANAEFGAEAIQICIEDNQADRAAVSQYPEEVKGIVARCVRGRELGWSMVKLCIDNDIEAEAALANYGREHDSLMQNCKAEFGHRGAARTKMCVDQAIKPARPPRN